MLFFSGQKPRYYLLYCSQYFIEFIFLDPHHITTNSVIRSEKAFRCGQVTHKNSQSKSGICIFSGPLQKIKCVHQLSQTFNVFFSFSYYYFIYFIFLLEVFHLVIHMHSYDFILLCNLYFSFR